MSATTARIQRAVAGQEVVWYWKHRDGFRPYDPDVIIKIERAYQNGESKVRSKTGKYKSTPMEIFFADMLQHDPVTGNTREVKREGPDGLRRRAKRFVRGVVRWLETGRPRRELFQEYQRRRELLRNGLGTREFEVSNLYKATGLCAKVAKSNGFFGVTMAAVVANSIWIAYDADYNTAPSLRQAEWHFQAVEYCFCAFFTVELLIRFGAFRRKRDCLSEGWFVFDTMLLLVMMLEMWIVPLCLDLFTDGAEDSAVFNQLYMFRMLRLLRLTRMARLLRLFPEMLTLVKGIKAAMSGVLTTMALLIITIFVFAIIFKAAVEDSQELAREYFSGTVVSMRTLLMHGTLLDGPAALLISIYERVGVFTACTWLIFIFMSSFTVLNMLIGILCEVVSQVSQSEKEEAEVAFLKNHVLDILDLYDTNNDQTIGEDEFDLLMQNIELHEYLSRFGTDVTGIISLKEVLFEGKVMGIVHTAEGVRMQRARKTLTFKDFMSVVLRLRGGHSARVTDVVELREYVRQNFERLENLMSRNSLVSPSPLPGASKQTTPKASPRPQPFRVVIVSARGLRNADWLPGAGKSDVFCVCSLVGKPEMVSRTFTCSDSLDPVWNHTAEFSDYQCGDCLRIDVMDRDVSFLKKDDHLGSALLASSCFDPHGFDGELALSNAGAGTKAHLTIFIPASKPESMTLDQTIQTVLTRMDEVCTGQQLLQNEVLGLHKQVLDLQTKVDAAGDVATGADVEIRAPKQ